MRKNFTFKNTGSKIFFTGILIFMVLVFVQGCFPEESLNVPVKDSDAQLESELDQYIDQNFIEEYGVAIRYRYDDNFLAPNTSVTPPKLEVVRPMLDFIEYYWFGPYLEVDNGEEFFRKYVPAEVVFLGGLIYRGNGTILLGTADAGARITFTNVNAIDPDDDEWRDLQLGTVYHEFAHIVHQNFKLPPSFESITPSGYTGPGSWFVLTDEDALQRGFVSPYGTSSPNEDFAEVVAFYLYDQDFQTKFLIDEVNCSTEDCVLRNEGREFLRQKVASISAHYEKVTGINLQELRDEVQSRIN